MSTTILIVEDDPNDETLILRALRKQVPDATVLVARDGPAALDILFAHAAPTDEDTALPRVVLLDLKLPKLTGLEVLERLRADARTADIPVVMFTSSNEAQDVQASYRLGANSYVRKPSDFSSFTAVVQQIGQYWLGFNERAPQAAT